VSGVILFTAILAGSDSLKPAPVGARSICFTDKIDRDSQGWELKEWPATSPRREAWRLRCVPHTLFDDYRTVVWVDASFTVTNLPKLLKDSEGFPLSGIKHHGRKSCYEEGRETVRIGQAEAAPVARQLEGYRREGFAPDALTISCVLVRQNTPTVTAFNELWDAEIRQHPGDNTQLSLDYCAWKTGIGVHHLSGARHGNPYAIHDHADHKRRRMPYR
jgi:hypothetical protein